MRKKCYRCGKIKLITEFSKDTRNPSGYKGCCKNCHNEYNKNWRKNNPEKLKERKRRYKEKHPEIIRAYQRKYRKLYPERYKQTAKKYRENLKFMVLAHYSNGDPICDCCDENYIEFLTIHHIAGDGAEHRKKISGNIYNWLKKKNFPEGFRVLCMNCNFSLGKFGYCPHQRKSLISEYI